MMAGRVLVAAMALLLSVSAAAAEKRVALVIGNASYQHVPGLANPLRDANLMAESLRGLGFILVGGGPRVDLDKAGFDRAVQEFGAALQGADVGLFYYAGHGVQVRGGNYLVPVGANPVREADVDFQMLDTSLVLRQMEGAGTRLNLVILDACRNNPFGGRGLRATAPGLATMQAPEGTLISFATQPGSVALDGSGSNSPFTAALADAIRKPGLDIFRTFNEVGLQVARTTGGTQQPWVSLSPIKGEFYFAGRNAGDPAPRDGVQPAAPDPAAQAWAEIKDSRNAALFEAFIGQFGSTFYGALARARLDELKRPKVAVGTFPRSDATADAIDIAKLRSAMPSDIPVNTEVLRTILTDPFFANAPPMRLERYNSINKAKDNQMTAVAAFHPIAHGVMRQDLEYDYSSEWKGPPRGTYRSVTSTEAITAVNGLVQLASRGTTRTTYPGSKGGPTNTSSGLSKIDRFSGTMFPITVGKEFSYRTFFTFPSSTMGDSINEYKCRVSEKRAAVEFHRDLTGDAFVVLCRVAASYTKSAQTNDWTSAPIFFSDLGAFLYVDTLDPDGVNVDRSIHSTLRTVTALR